MLICYRHAIKPISIPITMRFKLRQMEVFRAVMLTGSMNGAAKLLFISQPAVSRVIAYTEQALGMQLFERGQGKLTPTPEAELLYEEVESLYETALRVDSFAMDLAHKPQGTLALCCSPSLAMSFLPPYIARFRDEHPGVRLRFFTAPLSAMAHELLGRKAELAVSVLPIDHHNLIVEPFASGRMVCIAPPGHPLTMQDEVGLAEVAQYPLIVYSRTLPFGQLVASAFQQADVAWRAAVDIERADLACALVQAGTGVSIVDEFSVGGGGYAGIAIKPLKEVIPLTLSLVRSRLVRPSRHVRDFMRLVKDDAAPA